MIQGMHAIPGPPLSLQYCEVHDQIPYIIVWELLALLCIRWIIILCIIYCRWIITADVYYWILRFMAPLNLRNWTDMPGTLAYYMEYVKSRKSGNVCWMHALSSCTHAYTIWFHTVTWIIIMTSLITLTEITTSTVVLHYTLSLTTCTSGTTWYYVVQSTEYNLLWRTIR